MVPPGDRASARDVFVRNLKVASADAERAGLTLLPEPLFDCYHVGRVGSDVIARLEGLLAIVRPVQIAAMPSRAESDRGDLDYRAVFAAIGRLTYSGWTSCEYKAAEPTADALTCTRALDG
ncbi:hypothetical protein [Lichenifustis flavocetrariae]|uniref:Uncharacterized protein n=1 Tax=Lichenifustis flavocetrariae TaxID=2949735 RepID=A0AA41Z3X8_9HYPH|nr:hypothetical protein [Lichenifustis flavocetrariae]MCW6512330.1 hypothetical protein [Lichenifustis flavocetrariae]